MGKSDVVTVSPVETTDSPPDANNTKYSLLILDNDSSASQAMVGVSPITKVDSLAQCQNTQFYMATGIKLTSVSGIPFIDCSQNGTVLDEVLAEVQTFGVPCAVFYSPGTAGCDINPSQQWLKTSIPNLFTMLTSAASLQTVAILSSNTPLLTASIVNSSNNLNSNKSSRTALIALYVATAVVAVVLIVILGCAIVRIKRHPERYNMLWRRTGDTSASNPPDYATCARGLARAVLDSIPLVRVSRPKESEFDVESSESTGNAPSEKNDGEMKDLVHAEAAESSVSLSVSRVSVHTEALRAPEPVLYLPSRGSFNELAFPYEQRSENIDVSTPASHIGIYEYQDEDQCPICFEEFQDDEILRVLPCSHKFHSACVDPWLLSSASVCPFCRADLLQPAEDIASSNDNTDTTDISADNEDIVPGRTFLYRATHWRRISRPRLQPRAHSDLRLLPSLHWPSRPIWGRHNTMRN